MKVKCLMLDGGQPVFFIDENDGKMHEPSLVFIYPAENGQQNVTFQHMLAFCDKGECNRIPKEKVLVEYEVADGQMKQLFEQYVSNQRTRRSGIVNPNSAEGRNIMEVIKGGRDA